MKVTRTTNQQTNLQESVISKNKGNEENHVYYFHKLKFMNWKGDLNNRDIYQHQNENT
jgi:hypothetical protein